MPQLQQQQAEPEAAVLLASAPSAARRLRTAVYLYDAGSNCLEESLFVAGAATAAAPADDQTSSGWVKWRGGDKGGHVNVGYDGELGTRAHKANTS